MGSSIYKPCWERLFGDESVGFNSVKVQEGGELTF